MIPGDDTSKLSIKINKNHFLIRENHRTYYNFTNIK